jgi:16S rRNA (adenine1518-N6/adenine1519-N6)-dimethyltransferase
MRRRCGESEKSTGSKHVAQTKSQIQSLLSEADTAPRHRFGQNFMIDQNLVRTVAAAGNIANGDLLIEVGPGTGTLTEELLASPAAKVIAVEIDRDLAKMLRDRFADNDRFVLIEGDALSGKHQLNPDLLQALSTDSPRKLVANLPYNIASPLVIELLLAGVQTLVFTVQKEVADRLRAPAGGDAYGPLTVMVRTLPPQAFWPPPKIDSALVRMNRQDRLGSVANDFSRFVQQIFSFRRKTLKKSLNMSGFNAESMLEKTGLNGQMRPEEFTPEQFWQMFQSV